MLITPSKLLMSRERMVESDDALHRRTAAAFTSSESSVIAMLLLEVNEQVAKATALKKFKSKHNS